MCTRAEDGTSRGHMHRTTTAAVLASASSEISAVSSDLTVTLTLVLMSKTENCRVEWFRIQGLLLSKSRGTKWD